MVEVASIGLNRSGYCTPDYQEPRRTSMSPERKNLDLRPAESGHFVLLARRRPSL
jgi:hypothetical protein